MYKSQKTSEILLKLINLLIVTASDSCPTVCHACSCTLKSLPSFTAWILYDGSLLAHCSE